MSSSALRPSGQRRDASEESFRCRSCEDTIAYSLGCPKCGLCPDCCTCPTAERLDRLQKRIDALKEALA